MELLNVRKHARSKPIGDRDFCGFTVGKTASGGWIKLRSQNLTDSN
jgi:hypothetical protein